MNSWMRFLKQIGGLIVENKLDASIFIFKDTVFTRELENILSKITFCYKLLIENENSVPNNENKIRDILVNKYINNPEIKRRIELKYFILPEVPESKSTGRTDIRIQPPNSFYEQEAYYIIECKRIDNNARRGTSGLNYKYIRNGIVRFTTNFYSSYYKTNAMIGFVVEPIDIHANTEDINFLLENDFKKINTISLITKENFIADFEFHYSSNHLLDNSDNLKLYHLMLNFSR